MSIFGCDSLCVFVEISSIFGCGHLNTICQYSPMGIKRLNQNMAECEFVVRRLLELNMKITSVMATLNNNGDVHIQDSV